MKQQSYGTFDDFRKDDDGATLVEFSVVLGIFLFLIFGIIDFGRLGFSNVLAEKATEAAVRMAVVRPVICDGVPVINRRGLIGTLSLDLPNGSRCTERENLCVTPATVSCVGSSTQAQAAEIWAQVRGLMPVNANIENLQFSYAYDKNLNRVGARYAPIVTVEIVNLDFDFISPLGALARLAGASGESDLGQSFAFPAMSASLPAEDLG